MLMGLVVLTALAFAGGGRGYPRLGIWSLSPAAVVLVTGVLLVTGTLSVT